jgi:hypothetical protein
VRAFAVELNVDEQQASQPDFFGFPWVRLDHEGGDLPSAVLVQCESVEVVGSWINFLSDDGLILTLPQHAVYLVREIASEPDEDTGVWACCTCGCQFTTEEKTEDGCPDCKSYRIARVG